MKSFITSGTGFLVTWLICAPLELSMKKLYNLRSRFSCDLAYMSPSRVEHEEVL